MNLARPTVALLALSLASCGKADPAPSGGAMVQAAMQAGVPTGPHPRLFMGPANIAAWAARNSGNTPTRKLVQRCDDAVANPSRYARRGNYVDDQWPGTALACAFAYRITGASNAAYRNAAILYWQASLSDMTDVGDGKACSIANMNHDWRSSWNGEAPRPPMFEAVTPDTGYPMRWYGPFIPLVYDWMHGQPGVSDALLAQTRTCVSAWMDNYTLRGYLRNAPGYNYNAGFVVGKALAAAAFGNDGGDGHLWAEVVADTFGKELVGKGLAANLPGVLVGGDWGSWQYAPLGVAEYAAAARALEENGAVQPAMKAWIDAVMVRTVYATVPTGGYQFTGLGDLDAEQPHANLSNNQIDAVLIGGSSDQAASWAAAVRQSQSLVGGGFFWNALAEIRGAAPRDYRTQVPAPPLWYLARGLGNLYARTAWTPKAFWAVFSSPGDNDAIEYVGGDHAHFAAGNFVFTRGADHLIVDPSNYGEPSTWETNAPSADSTLLGTGGYYHTQTPWGYAPMVWARGTSANVFAARSDFQHAFDYDGRTEIKFAHRDWTMLPEGEIVLVDRVHTAAADRNMYVQLHANTGGTLTLAGSTATGTSGGSKVAIHAVARSGGTPAVDRIAAGSCKLSCNYPCGSCNAARMAVDEYALTVPGAWAWAVHVVDGLAAGEAAATVGSINDDTNDPAPKQNAGVLGASVLRAGQQSFVVATSAVDGATGATLTYRAPGASGSRHVVYDAPEASDGTSAVSASTSAGFCVITVTAGGGGGTAGRPLILDVSSAASGCTVTPHPDAPPAFPQAKAEGTPPTRRAAAERAAAASRVGRVIAKVRDVAGRLWARW